MFFARDNGSEVDIKVKWAPAEPDAGMMSAYIDYYELPFGEPPLTEAEEQRLLEAEKPDDYEDD